MECLSSGPAGPPGLVPPSSVLWQNFSFMKAAQTDEPEPELCLKLRCQDFKESLLLWLRTVILLLDTSPSLPQSWIKVNWDKRRTV